MDHATAILEDAGKAIDKSADQPGAAPTPEAAPNATETTGDDDDNRAKSDNPRKRKGNYPDYSIRQGGGRGRGADGDSKRHKKGDMGRSDYFRNDPDKRAKTQNSQQKRREAGEPTGYGPAFSQEEIDAEGRKPKRKVAVLIGYSGTGYKGMQISTTEKTIEGDIFQAFVKAGAISKANADDPKKAGLVRCARTDKGVHAAGNMISLKLIVEDENIVEKINEHLSPQIRVWGIERTIGSFSCYQACDSRWYEYLIPTHAFLPPHPSSWLAKQLEKLADDAGDREGYDSRQAEVKGFWEKVDEEQIKPILETIDEDIRWEVVKALQGEEEASAKAAKSDADVEGPVRSGKSVNGADVKAAESKEEKAEEAAIVINEPAASAGARAEPAPENEAQAPMVDSGVLSPDAKPTTEAAAAEKPQAAASNTGSGKPALSPAEQDRIARLRAATKRLRLAYQLAKRHYRIPSTRIERIQTALNNFLGTKNYHNYTIQKTFRDPSAKRNIKSFVVNKTPILIGEGSNEEAKSEWLSLKVHGQSFMMHQIRKMVGMVALAVRCGSDIDKTMNHSFTEARYSIPKVPGLGLMLERPVFDSYNNIQAVKHGRDKLVFDKYESEIEEFKRREIYARMFSEEEERGEFGRFFNHVDNFKEPYFLYLSSKGHEATEGWGRKEGYGEVDGGSEGK